MSNIVRILAAFLVVQTSWATTVDEQAKSAGFTKCLETTKTLAEFLVKQNGHASHDFWNKDFVNDRFFDSLIVKDYSDGDSHISLTIIPRGKQCDWAYTETYPVEKPCQIVREESFKELKFGGSLNNTSMMLQNDNGLYFYLTPSESGNACLVTKRELFYEGS